LHLTIIIIIIYRRPSNMLSSGMLDPFHKAKSREEYI